MTSEQKVNAAKSYTVGSLVRCVTHDMSGVCTIVRVGPPPPAGNLGADWATATYDIESARGERLLGLVATDLVPCLGNPAAIALGRMGGESTSPAKRAASARNGAKGGRPNKSAILARWDALREAHPDMIWDDIKTITVLAGDKLETRYRVCCVCPESYATFGGDPGNIHLSACRVIVGGGTPSEGALLTLVGLQRKATELERMDWTSLDERARVARKTLAKLRADYRATCDVANAPITDEEWARITSR